MRGDSLILWELLNFFRRVSMPVSMSFKFPWSLKVWMVLHLYFITLAILLRVLRLIVSLCRMTLCLSQDSSCSFCTPGFFVLFLRIIHLSCTQTHIYTRCWEGSARWDFVRTGSSGQSYSISIIDLNRLRSLGYFYIPAKSPHYGLNCIPSKFLCCSPNLPVPQNVTVFGGRDFKGVIKLKWGH